MACLHRQTPPGYRHTDQYSGLAMGLFASNLSPNKHANKVFETNKHTNRHHQIFNLPATGSKSIHRSYPQFLTFSASKSVLSFAIWVLISSTVFWMLLLTTNLGEDGVTCGDPGLGVDDVGPAPPPRSILGEYGLEGRIGETGFILNNDPSGASIAQYPMSNI